MDQVLRQQSVSPESYVATDSSILQNCSQICLECFKSCTALIPHCLEMGGEHASKHHISLLSNCASICELSAQFILSRSEFYQEACSFCADVCLHCAQTCESISGTDQQMSACADLCRKCADSCEELAAAWH